MAHHRRSKLVAKLQTYYRHVVAVGDLDAPQTAGPMTSSQRPPPDPRTMISRTR